MSINELILVPYDRIDYGSLDGSTLFELATQQDEPFIATSSFAELGGRRLPEARLAAVSILSTPEWDRHLTTFAITTLFELDRPCAAEVMSRLLETTVDPKILGGMVQCVLEDVDFFAQGTKPEFVKRLAAKVAAVAPDDFTDLEDRTEFLARFSA